VTDRIQSIRERLKELDAKVSDPEILRDQGRYRDVMRERSHLSAIDEAAARFENVLAGIEDAAAMAGNESDPELRAMAEEESRLLESKRTELEKALTDLLAPRDPLADKSVIMEIRAGTGGEEAALFAADLFRMYSRFADSRGWRVEVMSESGTELGGFREIIFSVNGESVYEKLRWESGVHRVQRVPSTEASGRIHTSAATVAVLPEAEDVDVKIDAKDLRIDTFCSSGAGGQSVNTTYSAVRIVHVPTGLVVQCQDERSQTKNREKAMKVLRARLYEVQTEEKDKERAQDRKSQVGSGDRSERIRTYNYPQNRVTDHRTGLTLHKLEQILEGNLDELFDNLTTSFNAARFQEL